MLVVDDEAAIALNLRYTLSSLGYLPATARTGADALQLVETFHPNFVIMDLRLRGSIDGIEVAARLRARQPSFALIYSSGADVDAEQKFRAAQTVPDAWLAKPYTLAQLQAALELADKNCRQREHR